MTFLTFRMSRLPKAARFIYPLKGIHKTAYKFRESDISDIDIKGVAAVTMSELSSPLRSSIVASRKQPSLIDAN